MLKISVSEFGTVGMHRRMRACADEFLPTVTVDGVHVVIKVVPQSSCSVKLQDKVN